MLRISYLDYARSFTMLLVIWGHFYNGDNTIPHHYIYSFHMPLFFLVSGMLHKYSDSIPFTKYLKTLLLPIVFFNVVCGIILSVFEGGSFLQTCFDKNFFVDGPTWFLLALFYCKLAQDFYRKYPIVVLLSWLLLFVFLDCLSILKYVFFPQAIMAYPFYFCGCYFYSKIDGILKSNYSLLWGGVCLLVSIAITTLHGRVSMMGVRFGFQDFPFIIDVILFYFNAYTGALMVLFFSVQFKERALVTKMAKSLITILCIHIIFVSGLIKLFLGWNSSMCITLPLAFIILLVCVFIHKGIERYCPIIIGKAKQKH